MKFSACGYSTPYTTALDSHLKNQGPYHDNLCPKCPERYYSRQELIQHMESANHVGFRCGLCPKVFDDNIGKTKHRKSCQGALEDSKTKFICQECGKVFIRKCSIDNHMKQVHAPQGNWPCEHCGKTFQTEFKLKIHVEDTHNKQQCTFCGALLAARRMKNHVLANHTEEHLKPFICQICRKGFATQEKLGNHMNIHTGNKPWAYHGHPTHI